MSSRLKVQTGVQNKRILTKIYPLNSGNMCCYASIPHFFCFPFDKKRNSLKKRKNIEKLVLPLPWHIPGKSNASPFCRRIVSPPPSAFILCAVHEENQIWLLFIMLSLSYRGNRRKTVEGEGWGKEQWFDFRNIQIQGNA